ncbi:MAG: hypothetical protein J0H14_18035 [Alphaproteobacteria bacterium]|nr:hypothetical protein [Alphaproteobacteria bacterium]
MLPHGEFPDAFSDIARDRENRVVIMTGTGEEFSGVRASPQTTSFTARPTVETLDRIHWEGGALLMNLLSIEVPVIAALNGPAWRHSEIPLLSDIVLASDTAASRPLRGRSHETARAARCSMIRRSDRPIWDKNDMLTQQVINGGVDSLPGAVLCAFLIGIAEALTVDLLGSQLRDVGVFLVLMLVLALRPTGLLRTAAGG